MELKEPSGAGDIQALASMNKRFIDDQRHRNPMTVPELAERMRRWLAGEYEAAVFVRRDETLGYALWRREAEQVYLRQFFIERTSRRNGLGRAAFELLRTTKWNGAERIRVEALVHNAPALGFWRAVGFVDYALTLERDLC